jgi:hypothetical protein
MNDFDALQCKSACVYALQSARVAHFLEDFTTDGTDNTDVGRDASPRRPGSGRFGELFLPVNMHIRAICTTTTNHAIPTKFSRCELSKLLHRSKFGNQGICPQITQITRMRKAGLNRSKQREQSFSLFPPFPPVRNIFICVNPCHVLRGERQSAGNSGFGCGWPRWEIRGSIPFGCGWPR